MRDARTLLIGCLGSAFTGTCHTIRSLVKGQRPIIRSDGILTRDSFYVNDGVAADLAAAEKVLGGGAGGEAYTFSSEIQVNVRELVGVISRVAGITHLEPFVLNDAPNEIPHQHLRAKKARRQHG
jgi:CDP-glucose 4,6-dehydratase